MKTEERKFADTTGEVMLAATGGRPLPDASWRRARILLSNERLVLATDAETAKIPLTDVEEIGGRLDASIDARQVADYVQVRLADRTYLIAASNHERFEESLFRGLLHGKRVDAKHPAVEGGVVTDAEWEASSITVDEDEIAIALHSGAFVALDIEEVSGLHVDYRTIDGEERRVVAASHVDERGTIVETHVAADDPTIEHLRAYLRRGMAGNLTNVDLSGTERAVLMALYAGISPFEIPVFLDRDVETVERIYDRLLRLEVVDEIRRRREVELNARGRNLADSISDAQ